MFFPLLLLVMNNQKYYPNLLKSNFGLRNRLHVNGAQFDHGRSGIAENDCFPRWPTEWDDYFVHEMRYRKPTKMFRVKT